MFSSAAPSHAMKMHVHCWKTRKRGPIPLANPPDQSTYNLQALQKAEETVASRNGHAPFQESACRVEGCWKLLSLTFGTLHRATEVTDLDSAGIHGFPDHGQPMPKKP